MYAYTAVTCAVWRVDIDWRRLERGDVQRNRVTRRRQELGSRLQSLLYHPRRLRQLYPLLIAAETVKCQSFQPTRHRDAGGIIFYRCGFFFFLSSYFLSSSFFFNA